MVENKKINIKSVYMYFFIEIMVNREQIKNKSHSSFSSSKDDSALVFLAVIDVVAVEIGRFSSDFGHISASIEIHNWTTEN